jgi:hypothetical protein
LENEADQPGDGAADGEKSQPRQNDGDQQAHKTVSLSPRSGTLSRHNSRQPRRKSRIADCAGARRTHFGGAACVG